MKALILIILTFSGFGLIKAQQLTYKPINPAFGGNSYNYTWLQNSATAQNQHIKSNKGNKGKSALNSFSESINRQVINNITRNLFGSSFEDGNFTPGVYNFGSLYIEISESSEGLLFSILDTETGEQTEIIIPE